MRLCCGLLLALTPLTAAAADLPSSQHSFVVIAHRGNHTHAHENTLKAIEAAIEVGADYAEIDVRRTVDGHYVLMHDRTVDRMTDGHGAVKDLTLAQLQKLQVRDPKRPHIPPDRIPTFTEALKLIKGRLNLYLDFKEGDRGAAAKLVREAGVARQVLVYDDIESVPEWRKVAPELPLIISPPENAKTPQQLIDFAVSNRIEVLDGGWKAYSREMTEAATRAGLRIWPDIQAGQEDAVYFDQVVKRGFTGVQTDHPEELITWLKQQHIR